MQSALGLLELGLQVSHRNLFLLQRGQVLLWIWGFDTMIFTTGHVPSRPPHDRATVTSFVGAGVAAARGRRRITGVDVNGTQLVPAEHGQKVLLPWGGWAVGRLVGRSSIAPPVGTSIA